MGQLYAVCGDLTEAEEVVAEAFARATARRRLFEGLDSPEARLRVTAVNIARTRHRRRRVGECLGLVAAAGPPRPHLTDDRLAGAPPGPFSSRRPSSWKETPVPRRLDPEIVRRAEDAAQKPDFAAVLDRGRALSRRRMATATAATVVIVAGLVGATQLPDRQAAVPVVPVESPTPTATATATESPKPNRPSAQEIVDDPGSQVVDVQTAPGGTDTRIALWRWCQAESCQMRSQALVLTRDGFDTSTVADATWTNALVGVAENGAAVVVAFRARLSIQVAAPDGSVADAKIQPVEAPVAPGEVVLGNEYTNNGLAYYATDATGMTAHQIPVPDETFQLIETDGGHRPVRAHTSPRLLGLLVSDRRADGPEGPRRACGCAAGRTLPRGCGGLE